MITILYFLLLAAASAEDYKSHKVNRYVVLAVWLLGIINIVLEKENRWVSVALTCVCFAVLFAAYVLIKNLKICREKGICFGGADVRLIPAMMLVQGWDVALTGVFIGFAAAVLYYMGKSRGKKEIPLVPWMSMGCLLVEIFYLFFEKSMI